jgi:hypothetical protein
MRKFITNHIGTSSEDNNNHIVSDETTSCRISRRIPHSPGTLVVCTDSM